MLTRENQVASQPRSVHSSDILMSLKRRPFAQAIAVKYGFVAIEPEQGTEAILCHVMQVSLAGFAPWKRRTTHRKPLARTQLRTLIGSIRDAVKEEAFGSSKTFEEPVDAQNLLGGARIEYVICNRGIRRRYQATTDSRHTFAVVQKLLERRFNSSNRIVPTALENKSAHKTDHGTRRPEHADLFEYIALF